jgi:hypothetical protein
MLSRSPASAVLAVLERTSSFAMAQERGEIIFSSSKSKAMQITPASFLI